MEVCDIGHVDVDPADPLAVGNYLEDMSRSAFARWQAAMVASDDSAVRAVGLYTGLRHEEAADGPYDAGSLAALILLAEDSHDPFAYGVAYEACAKGDATLRDPLCQPISAAGWTRVDPDNAVPWLALADQQEKGGDQDAATAALVRAGDAKKVENPGVSLYAVASRALPGSTTPPESMQLAVRMTGIEAAMPMLSLGASRFCVKPKVLDERRRAACARLADLFAGKSSTLLEFAISGRLGEAAGWPRQRLDEFMKMREALWGAALNASAEEAYKSLDCNAVERINAFFAKRAQLGELGAARDDLAHSGKTVDEMAQQYRDEHPTEQKRYQDSLRDQD